MSRQGCCCFRGKKVDRGAVLFRPEGLGVHGDTVCPYSTIAVLTCRVGGQPSNHDDHELGFGSRRIVLVRCLTASRGNPAARPLPRAATSAVLFKSPQRQLSKIASSPPHRPRVRPSRKMNLSLRFARRIRPLVQHELDIAACHEARGDFRAAFVHLERAHVLGQASTVEHVRVHWAMLHWALRQRAAAEAAGQAWRLAVRS